MNVEPGGGKAPDADVREHGDPSIEIWLGDQEQSNSDAG
jgi:hypothetical protein